MYLKNIILSEINPKQREVRDSRKWEIGKGRGVTVTVLQKCHNYV